MFDDQAHALQYKWRSPKELQSLAIGGTFGSRAGILRPFDLNVKDLRTELRSRGVDIDNMTRPYLQDSLDQILRGVIRVPALLLTNPTQQLSSLNLEKYEIVANEPLHDIKGHIINLITELPSILPPGDTTTKCTHLIENCLAKEKKSGADLRRAIIQIFLLLKDLDCSSRVLLLLQTIIKIGEIAYSLDDRRCPRQLLQLYNSCWIHMELCRDLFSAPAKLTRTRMFGHYVHAITAHSPTQYELACLRSLNTENQERLFGQARGIAEACTNHHPDNVIPQIMLRLQAKQEQRIILAAVQKGDSQVSHVAKELPPLPGTTVKMSFITHREDSWQIHLQRISCFLIAGEDVWWSCTPNGFHFNDGDTDASNPRDSVTLLHHRYNSLADVEERRNACWKRIVEERIVIPAKSIKLYNSRGNKTGRLVYDDHSVTLEHQSTDSSHSSATSSKFVDSSADSSHSVDSSDSSSTSDTEVAQCNDHTVTHTSSTISISTVAHGLAHNSDTPADVLDTAEQTQTVREAADGLSEVRGIHGSGPDDRDTTPGTSSASSEGVFRSSYINLDLEKHNGGLKTSLGNCMKQLLGCDDDLVLFDAVRFKLKEAKKAGKLNNMTATISNYKQLAEKLSTLVKSVQSRLAEEVQQIEYQHFQAYGTLPAKITGSHYTNLLKERKLATSILQNM